MALRLSILFLLLAISSVRAQDTFSIVAIDTVTGEVGSAGASCLDKTLGLGCAIISDVHPGIGAIHTQAQWSPDNQIEASSAMELDSTPQQILHDVTTNDIDGTPGIRQYGVVSLKYIPHAAAFTGDSCLDYKGHIVGPYYSIQGNILKGREILEQIETNFLNTKGTLADRLMAGLQGAKVPGADTRCLSNGTSSLSSFLRVARPDDDPSFLTLDIIIPQVKAGKEPIDSLQHRYDLWKAAQASVQNGAVASGINVTLENLNRVRIQGLNFGDTASFALYSIDGRQIIQATVSGTASTFSLREGTLRSGVYLYHMCTNGGRLATGKLLIAQ